MGTKKGFGLLNHITVPTMILAGVAYVFVRNYETLQMMVIVTLAGLAGMIFGVGVLGSPEEKTISVSLIPMVLLAALFYSALISVALMLLFDALGW